MFILLLFSNGVAVLADDPPEQVLIEAVDGVNYDMEHNITTAAKNVELTRGELKIYADQIVYYGNTGVVEASGNVRLKNQLGEYRTDQLTYNIVSSCGKLDSFIATLKGEPQDFHMKGQGLELTPASAKIATVEITRCPKPRPDYVFKASQVKIVGNKVQLKNVVVKAKGIPIFWLPVLSFYTNKAMPELVPSYHKEDGFKLKFNFSLFDAKDSEWSFIGDLSVKGDDSNIGMEYETNEERWKNQLMVVYNWDDWVTDWNGEVKLTDVYTYETDLYTVVADGSKELSNAKESQLGLSFTRKYWQTGIGKWQAGVLVRRLESIDIAAGNGSDYGGTYFGFRLDYQPNPNLKFSYLRIKSQTEPDYRDLMEDFGLGDNLLYEATVPLNKDYKLGFNGTYNLDESKWYHQVYSLTQEGCCFSPILSYDMTDHSWEGKIGFKF